MKKMLMLLVLMLMFSSIFAESVILNDGRILKGEIVGKKSDSIYFRSEGNIYLLTRDLVKQIKNDGNLTITKLTYKKKDYVKDGVDITQLIPLGEREEEVTYGKPVANNMHPTHKTKMNLPLVGLSVLFGVCAWDYFVSASDINDAIKFNKDFLENSGGSIYEESYEKLIDNLEKAKTRKMITASFLTAASALSFGLSIESVEIKASPTSINLTYKF